MFEDKHLGGRGLSEIINKLSVKRVSMLIIRGSGSAYVRSEKRVSMRKWVSMSMIGETA